MPQEDASGGPVLRQKYNLQDVIMTYHNYIITTYHIMYHRVSNEHIIITLISKSELNQNTQEMGHRFGLSCI